MKEYVEPNIIDHPLGEELAQTITQFKNTKYLAPGYRELLFRISDLQKQIPMMYQLKMIEFVPQRKVFRYSVDYQVQNIDDTFWYATDGLRMAKGQTEIIQLEETGKSEPPILHLPENWRILIHSRTKIRPYQDIEYRLAFDYGNPDPNGRDIYEELSIYWQPEIPAQPKILKPPSHLLGYKMPLFPLGKIENDDLYWEIINKHSKIGSIPHEEFVKIHRDFTTEVVYTDSEEITDLTSSK